MEISERDLFNFVFYKKNLTEVKAEYLENSDEFRDEINFFFSLKELLSEDISAEIKEKINLKITDYKLKPVIDINPSVGKTKRKKKSEG